MVPTLDGMVIEKKIRPEKEKASFEQQCTFISF